MQAYSNAQSSSVLSKWFRGKRLCVLRSDFEPLYCGLVCHTWTRLRDKSALTSAEERAAENGGDTHKNKRLQSWEQVLYTIKGKGWRKSACKCHFWAQSSSINEVLVCLIKSIFTVSKILFLLFSTYLAYSLRTRGISFQERLWLCRSVDYTEGKWGDCLGALNRGGP